MKNLKLSFALIIAVLAVGVTVATKANFTGKKRLTACFSTSITLQDASGAAANFRTPVANSTLCSTVDSWFTSGIKYLRTVPGTAVTNCDEVSLDFCCIEFEEISNPGSFPNVPTVNIDGTPKKYEILDVTNIYCRP